MNAASFTYEKYIGRVGYPLNDVWNPRTNRPQAGFTELGRCSAKSLVVRPRTEGEAAMLRDESDNTEFWLHVVSDKAMGLRHIPD